MTENDKYLLKLICGGKIPDRVRSTMERAHFLNSRLGGGDFNPQVLVVLVALSEQRSVANAEEKPAAEEKTKPAEVPAEKEADDEENPFEDEPSENPPSSRRPEMDGMPPWVAEAVPGKTRVEFDIPGEEDETRKGVFLMATTGRAVRVREDGSEAPFIELPVACVDPIEG